MGDSPDEKPSSLSGGGDGEPQTSPSGSSSSAGGQQVQGRTLMECKQPQEVEEGVASFSALTVDQKEPSTPTQEEVLLEEVKTLREKVGTLKKQLKRAKQIFGNEWGRRHDKWERMEAQLQALKEKQGKLEKTADHLKKHLTLTGRNILLKMEQIRLLTMLARLKAKGVKLGKEVKKSTTLVDKEVKDAGRVVAATMWRKEAVSIFPEEVWKIIFGNVSDPKDLWNLCNTCQLFDTILSKWKTGWLLGQALPYLYRHLPGEKLLGSRLVCKSWRKTIDNFLGDNPSLRPHDPDNSDARRLDFVNPMMEMTLGGGYHLSFSSCSDMTLFEDPAFLEKWKKNGLIGRGLTLDLGRDYDEDTFEEKQKSRDNENAEGGFGGMWTKFQNFLSSFGKEVWHLSISFCLNSDEGDSWEKLMLPFLLVEIFNCFPNTRKLQVRNIGDLFREVINPESLPPAPKLESLELSCYEATIAPVMLPRYRLQLRQLNLNSLKWRGVNDLDWPNLTELHLSGFGAIGAMEDFQCLIGVGPRIPQLGKLGIHVAEGWQPDTGRILRIIHELCLSTRLNTLRLEGGFRALRTGKDDSFYDPAIAQIKTLEFNHYTDDEEDEEDEESSAPDYAFLLRCFPLLENLNVFVRKDSSYYNQLPMVPTALALEDRRMCEEMKRPLKLGKEEEIVEVNKYIYDGEMYKSNIWELMPFLKVFTFQWDIYTRDGYESYKKLDKKN